MTDISKMQMSFIRVIENQNLTAGGSSLIVPVPGGISSGTERRIS